MRRTPGGYALTFWLPTAVKGVSGGSTNNVLAWTGLIYACGIVGVFISGRSSDRTGDRKWHCVGGMAVTGCFLACSTIPGQPVWAVLTWLCLTGFVAYFWPSPFWALPTLTLTASAAAVSIGFINMFANLAGFLGNYTVGGLKAHGFSDQTCLLFLACCYLIGSTLIALIQVKRIPPAVS